MRENNNRLSSQLTEDSQQIMNHNIKESIRVSYLHKGRVVAKEIWTRKNQNICWNFQSYI